MSKIVIDISEHDAHSFMALALGIGDVRAIYWTYIDTDGKKIDIEFVPYEEDCEDEE